MSGLVLGAALVAGLLAGGHAAADHPAGCLSSGDAFEAVASHQVVSPAAAIVAARQAVPNADVLRAALCREPGALVYLIMALRRDGRLMRVVVEAASGRIKTVR